jgi:hypothetical protein
LESLLFSEFCIGPEGVHVMENRVSVLPGRKPCFPCLAPPGSRNPVLSMPRTPSGPRKPRFLPRTSPEPRKPMPRVSGACKAWEIRVPWSRGRARHGKQGFRGPGCKREGFPWSRGRARHGEQGFRGPGVMRGMESRVYVVPRTDCAG